MDWIHFPSLAAAGRETGHPSSKFEKHRRAGFLEGNFAYLLGSLIFGAD